MKILHSFDECIINKSSALTVGKFDGLHMGHYILIDRIVQKKTEDFVAIAVTFDRPPDNTISGRLEKVLMSQGEKRALMEHHGVDFLVELPFDEAFMRMKPEVFIQNLTEKLHMKYMIVGDDFTFGYKGQGNASFLEELSGRLGFSLDVIPKIRSGNREISSTYIREEIAQGNVAHANELLGYSYFIIGDIVHGNQIGSSKIGRPTINIVPPEDKLLPPNGVYVTEVVLLGRTFHGVTNVGLRPTVREGHKRIGVETHILDFTGNVYDKQAKVIFKEFLRPEKQFETFDELKAQIEKDVHTTYIYFNQK